jgi:hypothetical protein
MAAYLKEHRSPLMPAHRTGVGEGSFRGGLESTTSFNWSGYVDSPTTTTGLNSHPITYVVGQWNVPAVDGNCTNEDQIEASWVGIDGANDQTVEQDGTISSCFKGVAVYGAWYEMYPHGSVTVRTVPVHSNDSITASVYATQISKTTDSYTLHLEDNTTLQSFKITKDCLRSVCANNSAEWIVERPALGTTGITPLPDFDTASFTFMNVRAKGVRTTAGGFTYGSGMVMQLNMVDSTSKYLLDCIGQTLPGGQIYSPHTCPTQSPSSGTDYTATWDDSY